MYFFSDKKLAEDLSKQILTEKQKFHYLLLVCLLAVLHTTQSAAFLMWSGRENYSFFIALNDILLVAYNISLLCVTFTINTKGDNKDYTTRLFCLSLPIGVKTNLVSIIFVLPAFVYSLAVGPSLEELEAMDPNKQIELSSTEELFFFFGYLFSYLFSLWRYVVCFKIAAGVK
jgi:hypothetical protein